MKKALLLLMVSSLVGCMLPSKKMYMRSYVSYYYDFETIDIQSHPEYKDVIIIYADGRYSFLGGFESKEQAQINTYDALCEKHNDMTYNRTIKYHASNPPLTPGYVGVDFVSIDIVSNADFDAEHSAGESLNDIVLFKTLSPKPFIDNGYKGSVLTTIEKDISELLPDDLVLLEGYSTYSSNNTALCDLILNSGPTMSKTHTFTVTMTADDGRVFSDSIEMTFE